MPAASDSDHSRLLKTARGTADPVLVRLSHQKRHLLLLADDASYDRAGLIVLHNVRCVQIRRSFLPQRQMVFQPLGQLVLRRHSLHVLAVIPGMPAMRVADRGRSFAMLSLTQAHYQALRTVSPRRLMQAIAPARQRTFTGVALGLINAVHRIRFAIRNTLVPKLAR